MLAQEMLHQLFLMSLAATERLSTHLLFLFSASYSIILPRTGGATSTWLRKWQHASKLSQV